MTVAVVLAMHAIMSVATAGGAVPFVEDAFDRELRYLINGPGVPFGRGVAVIDLDEDGDLDVVALGHATGLVGLFENDGTGLFTPRSTGSGIPSLPVASGITAADYDNDGDLDLYISNWLTPDVLARNDGDFEFTEVTAAAGLGSNGAGTGCTWADYDGDGWLDLYVCNRGTTNGSLVANALYRNLGDGTFVDVAVLLGVEDENSPTFQAAFIDFDRDGDGDLYLSTDKGYAAGETNRLFRNDGGTFVDITAVSATGVSMDSMGIAVGDFDGNGFEDMYCTNTPPGNVLYLNNGTMPFVDVTATADVESFAVGWGAAFLDFDNDMVQELYVCNSNGANRLYDYNTAFPCEDISHGAGVDADNFSYCLASGDIDGDGDIDIVVQDDDRLRLYMNFEGQQREHVIFKLRMPGPNRYAVGGIVEIEAGGVSMMRSHLAGTAYKSQSSRRLHFGLGDNTVVDTITASWPGGGSRTITSLAAGEVWTIYHADLLFDADQNGVRSFDDYQAFAGCVTGSVPFMLVPGCEMMDGTGDGDVDGADAALFLADYSGDVFDCDQNGIPDLVDMGDAPTSDANGNAIPDICEAGGDLNGDGIVNVDDLVTVILNWGPCPLVGCVGDTNADDVVNVDDLVAVILSWTV